MGHGELGIRPGGPSYKVKWDCGDCGEPRRGGYAGGVFYSLLPTLPMPNAQCPMPNAPCPIPKFYLASSRTT
ncbi:MAG: hypothetical protein F6J93_04065 [Oscillatoria sp. SIO1A7]|nr:hypothetical protein [Oscillatoria sp. SIO1A7]